MCALKDIPEFEKYLTEGPQSALERQYIEEFLKEKGYSLKTLNDLPEDERQELLRAACTYASLKLAEVESRSRFRQEIQTSS